MSTDGNITPFGAGRQEGEGGGFISATCRSWVVLGFVTAPENCHLLRERPTPRVDLAAAGVISRSGILAETRLEGTFPHGDCGLQRNRPAYLIPWRRYSSARRPTRPTGAVSASFTSCLADVLF